MSNTVKIVIGILVALILIGACVIAAVLIFRQPAEPEATPTEAATLAPTAPPATEPAEGEDDSWGRVEAAGKMVVGTAADYPPFEYYTGDFMIDGFDVALMDEIGRQLGVQIEYRDFAFDGLGNALQLGQLDAAIAAISATPERAAVIGFSNVYLVGEDGILARADSDISLATADDLGEYRLGVQRGTVYDDWARTELVDTGKLPADQLFAYEKAEDAVRDLTQDRVDLVMLDLGPAEAFALEGMVKVVAQGLNQQKYVIALPKGSIALKEKIDGALTDLHNSGYIAQLAKQYLDLEPEEILPTPTPTAEPEVTNTPAPPPTCVDGMTFVQHMDEGGSADPPQMQPGQPFTKVWRVKNTGTCTWDGSYRVVYVDGNSPASRMGGEPTNIQGQVLPGQTYDIAVNLVAPLKPGSYVGIWQMENGQQKAFGERLRVRVQVLAAPTVTPAPTQTPVAGIAFTVDRDQIKAGECVNLYWKVENVQAVFFYAEGERWQDNGVVGEGTSKECPPVTTTYYLRVVLRDGSVEIRQITVDVDPVTEAPNIRRFTVDPPNQITLGQCVQIRWEIEGDISKVTLTANDAILWDSAPVKGSYQDCPGSVGAVGYGLAATGPGGTSQAHQTINIVDPATATPAPTVAPEAPVIYAFSVSPAQISAGECVNISWSAGGGTAYVQIKRNIYVLYDNAPLQGTTQDCPNVAGSSMYSVVASNVAGNTTSWDQQVTVTEGEEENPLAGTRWQAINFYDGTQMVTALEGTSLTAQFGASGSLNGSSGCNTYSARYVVQGISLAITPPSSTNIACGEPAGVMEQEAAYLAALSSAGSYSVEAGQLYIQNPSGEVIVEFVEYE